MRMNYKTYPTDYIQELKATNRKKARCFLEYWDDMEHGESNSLRFYAQSWEVGKSTVQRWQEEFDHEADLFLSHWVLRNNQHNKSVKNQVGHQQDTWDSNKAQNIGNDNNIMGQQRDEALNLSNNNTRGNFNMDKNYIDFFMVYSSNNKFAGKKSEAYPAFSACDVDVHLLKLAAIKYIHDKDVQKPVGVKKFLQEQMYLPYLPTYIEVFDGQQWYEGEYNTTTYELKDINGYSLGSIEPSLLVELFEKQELKYITQLTKVS